MKPNPQQIIRDFWEEYKSHAVPANAPEVQQVETRRAFYTGFTASMHLLQSLDDGMSDKEALELLQKVEDEITGFLTLIKLGVN